MATSNAEASSSIGQAVTDRAQADGMQSVAFGTLLPSQADADAALVGNVNAEVAMAGYDALALGLLGGAYSANGSETGRVLYSRYSSWLDFNIDMTDMSNTNLMVGLLDPLVSGTYGFDSLRFRMNIEGAWVTDITFSSLGTAISYFDDTVEVMG